MGAAWVGALEKWLLLVSLAMANSLFGDVGAGGHWCWSCGRCLGLISAIFGAMGFVSVEAVGLELLVLGIDAITSVYTKSLWS